MSIELEVIDLDDVAAETAESHLKCCENDEFFCGEPFHPEAVAEGEPPCELCVEVFRQHVHEGLKPHLHCPFDKIKVCWRSLDG